MTSELITFNHLRCHSSSTALGTRTGYWKRTRRVTDEMPHWLETLNPDSGFKNIDCTKQHKRKHSNPVQLDFHHRNDVGCNEVSDGNVWIELAVFGQKILLVLTERRFLYNDKVRNSKRYPFENVKSFWHLIWNKFCHSGGANSIKTNLQTCNLWTG